MIQVQPENSCKWVRISEIMQLHTTFNSN